MNKIATRMSLQFSILLLIITIFIGTSLQLYFKKSYYDNVEHTLLNQVTDIAQSLELSNEYQGMHRNQGHSKQQHRRNPYKNLLQTLNTSTNNKIEIINRNYQTLNAYDDLPTNVDNNKIALLQDAFEGSRQSYITRDSNKNDSMIAAAPITNQGHVESIVVMTVNISNLNYLDQQAIFMIIGIYSIALIAGIMLIKKLSKQITKPILEITKASQQIANENFDINLDYNKHDEVGELAENINTMSAALNHASMLRKQEEINQREFFSNVSHELKTPLTVVINYLSMLTDDNTSDDKKIIIEQMIKECHHSESLINNLLDLASLQSPSYTLSMETFDTQALIEDAIRSQRALAKDKGLTIDYISRVENHAYTGNYQLLRQLITIIINNSIKFSDVNTHIVLLHEVNALAITNTGITINKQQINHIFDKFYTTSDGHGIGLNLAQEIAHHHDLEIVVESEHHLTTFTIQEKTDNSL